MKIPPSVRAWLKNAGVALLKIAAEDGKQFLIHEAEARWHGRTGAVLIHEEKH